MLKCIKTTFVSAATPIYSLKGHVGGYTFSPPTKMLFVNPLNIWSTNLLAKLARAGSIFDLNVNNKKFNVCIIRRQIRNEFEIEYLSYEDK